MFRYFSLLPKEIQDMIWSHSFTPQLISLSREIYNFSPQHAPSFMFLLGGDEPYTHFTMETITRPTSPYLTAHLEPVDVETPTALAVCRQSRRLALSKGYKAWRMERGDGKVRDIMWNPQIDMVLFVNACSGHCFELFLEQFPTQVKEVEKLALPHGFWVGNNTVAIGSFTMERLWQPLMSFTALKQLFVFVNKQFWEGWVENFPEMGHSVWMFPNNVRRTLYVAREDYKATHPKMRGLPCIGVPRVSVSWSHDAVLRGEDVELQLG